MAHYGPHVAPPVVEQQQELRIRGAEGAGAAADRQAEVGC